MSGPLPGFLRPVTLPASWLYGAAIQARNKRFDRGRGIDRVKIPVISVGNVTVGGVGKSPMVAALADELIQAGHAPVIGMRGYGARAGQLSDEEAEYHDRLPGVPVASDPHRFAALERFLADHPRTTCVLLDDGFQHRQMHRDLDLVLIDATRPGLDGQLLPAGFLREPPGALRRADAVVVTRADAVDGALAEAIHRHHGARPLAWCRHVWRSLRVFEGAAPGAEEPVSWLAGRSVLTMLGVGHPASIRRQIEAAGATIASNVPARDHERYGPGKIRQARARSAGVDAVLMTGKDWVKTRGLIDWPAWPVPIVVPSLRLEFIAGREDLMDRVLGAVSCDADRPTISAASD